MKRKQLEKQKGITLVALVVTIVVLIILAGVAINLSLGNNGLFNKAKQAKENYKQAEANEQVAINQTAEYMEKVATQKQKESELAKLKAGDYIKYDTGISSVGENGIIICRVLYDVSSEYGVQIISDKSIANVTLGGSNWATGRDAYNNAISILNTEAEKYLNKIYATDARCVGSVPTTKKGKFVNKNLENVGPVTLKFSSTVEGANNMKESDTNYKTDKKQMESLNIMRTGGWYWQASRFIGEDSSYYNFNMVNVSNNGIIDNYHLCSVHSDGKNAGYQVTYGFRPCFSLKDDIKITGGNGTSEQPYTM